jgi:hypothetical protein
MATITERKRKDGSVAYRAEIKLRKNGKILHQESKTFGKKMLAAKWTLEREAALESVESIECAPSTS